MLSISNYCGNTNQIHIRNDLTPIGMIITLFRFVDVGSWNHRQRLSLKSRGVGFFLKELLNFFQRQKASISCFTLQKPTKLGPQN